MNYEPTKNPNRYPIPSGAFRCPKRICITMPNGAYQRLLERSDKEGRSLSNLAAYLLESTLSCPEGRIGRSA